jgi:hypothetical protein
MKSDRVAILRRTRVCLTLAVVMAACPLVLCAVLTGCSSSALNQHVNALSASLAPVVDQSAEAYRSAVALHNLRGDYEAVVAYEEKDASYNPRNAPVLLSERDIQARLAVLAALQVYSQSLIEISRGADSPELQAASKSVGDSLTSVGNDLAPSIDKVLGIAAAEGSTTTTTVTTVSSSTRSITSTTSSTVLSPEVRNGVSTGVEALGQFLVSRKIEKELPGKIVAMDPTVDAFCKSLVTDIGALQRIGGHDYDRILDKEKEFILRDQQPGSDANPQELRAEIMKLPEIARQQREANEMLEALQAAIANLALTHHALAGEAQQNNPASLQEKLGNLAAAGSNLGNFYSSLPTE